MTAVECSRNGLQGAFQTLVHLAAFVALGSVPTLVARRAEVIPQPYSDIHLRRSGYCCAGLSRHLIFRLC